MKQQFTQKRNKKRRNSFSGRIEEDYVVFVADNGKNYEINLNVMMQNGSDLEAKRRPRRVIRMQDTNPPDFRWQVTAKKFKSYPERISKLCEEVWQKLRLEKLDKKKRYFYHNKTC